MKKEETYINLKLLAIDPWRCEGMWEWNDCRLVEEDVVFLESELTPRKICKWLRDKNFLTKQSKGMLKVDMGHDLLDGCLITILEKSTNRPVLALSNIH